MKSRRVFNSNELFTLIKSIEFVNIFRTVNTSSLPPELILFKILRASILMKADVAAGVSPPCYSSPTYPDILAEESYNIALSTETTSLASAKI